MNIINFDIDNLYAALGGQVSMLQKLTQIDRTVEMMENDGKGSVSRNTLQVSSPYNRNGKEVLSGSKI